jgi:DNA polymerase elongation subunit (family B)
MGKLWEILGIFVAFPQDLWNDIFVMFCVRSSNPNKEKHMNNNNLQPTPFRRLAVVDIETVSLDPTELKGALDAMAGQIVCIGLLFDDGERITEESLTGTDEALILRRFWELVKPTDVLVGHNILDFDLPFIRQRCWIRGIVPSRSIDCRRYYTTEVLDTLQLWTNWGFKTKGVSLDNLGIVLGCGQKTGNGSSVAQWWSARDTNSIASYCIEDVRLTYRVFCRLTYQPVPHEPESSAAESQENRQGPRDPAGGVPAG